LAIYEPVQWPVPDWSDAGVSEEAAGAWERIVGRLWTRPMKLKDGRLVPHVAHFHPEGKAAWVARYKAHVAEMNAADFPPHLRGAWGKLREYAGRLALILALLDHAADPTSDPEAIPDIGPRITENTWALVDYFKQHARRVHAAIARGRGFGGGSKSVNAATEAVVDWIRSGAGTEFTERDIKQARRWIDDADLAEALKALVTRNAIRPRPIPERGPKGGRPASAAYDVNPALLDSHNLRNAQ
jgi:hypothetical protein